MRTIVMTGACCLFVGLASAHAADPMAKTSTEDFVKAIQAAPCDNGYPRDEDGICPTVTDPGRGFSLTEAATQRLEHAPAAGNRPPPSTGGVRVASANGAAALHSSQPKALSDLLITFKLGSAEMAPEGKAQAAAFAAALMDSRVGNARFEIAGHTDASGSSDRNMALSAARAEAVKSYLISQGVDASRLEARGYGSTRLAVPNAPEDAANRRVEAHRLD
jgi:outer membrane protein OmpA-like peptidoglycan-associated protein